MDFAEGDRSRGHCWPGRASFLKTYLHGGRAKGLANKSRVPLAAHLEKARVLAAAAAQVHVQAGVERQVAQHKSDKLNIGAHISERRAGLSVGAAPHKRQAGAGGGARRQ